MIYNLDSTASDLKQVFFDAENTPYAAGASNGATPEESRPTHREEPQRISTLSDLNSLPVSALDRTITITRFPTMGAKVKFEIQASLREFAPYLLTIWGLSKDRLPWFKLASFGDKRKAGSNCLRSNENMLLIDGVEVDYDAGKTLPEEAARLLREAGVCGLIYTTPSHTTEKPKWRAFCPFSIALPTRDRAANVAKLNFLFNGTLDPASFTMSQSFYGGNVTGKPEIAVFVVEGRALDLASEIPMTGKDGKPWKAPDNRNIVRPRVPLPDKQAGTLAGMNMLETACNKVAFASPGTQEKTLVSQCWHVGRLIDEGRVDRALAVRLLEQAAGSMTDEAGRKPWQPHELSDRIRIAMRKTTGIEA